MFHRNSIPSIHVKELMEMLSKNEKLTLLDVRRPQEWKQTGVIPGSILVEMQTLPRQLNNGLNLKDKEPIIVICRTGNRSSTVTRYLIDHLGLNAVNLEGGVVSWHHHGGEFERI